MFDFDFAWRSHWALLDLPAPPQAALAGLMVAWDEPQRRYHTLQHLGECLVLFDEARASARRPGEVAIALWYHDAVYDPQRQDNEARSADWAAQVLQEAGATPEVVERVGALVLATRHRAQPADDDGRLVVDIDLAILGADALRFDEYDRQIRAEYAFVPELTFRARRAEVLRGFLDRPAIYATPQLARRFETAARVNLERALRGLA